MAQAGTRHKEILRELGDGLALRRATVEDTAALAAFNASIHLEDGQTEPNNAIEAWTRDLMLGEHPTFKVGDFTLVEDTHARGIVSTCNLISQTWTYEGIPFGVGRPELVATHPDYRNRGLVRAQFEVLHEWSEARGERLQAITGIPYYYRRFGYEMGLSLAAGRSGYGPHVPKLKEGEQEPFRIRTATDADIPSIMQLYERSTRRSMIACARDEETWRYELGGRTRESLAYREFAIVETPDGTFAGFLAHSGALWNDSVIALVAYELEPGVSWLLATPVVVRYLQKKGEEYAQRDGKGEWQGFGLWLGDEHPAYEAFHKNLPRKHDPYAWYVRVADLPGFLTHIASILEKRLHDSAGSGYTGELKISFYADGLRMAFESGSISRIEKWQPTIADGGAAAFPDLTFLQLMFGYRSLEELEHAYADCWTGTNEARALLNAMFPRKPSHVWPIEGS